MPASSATYLAPDGSAQQPPAGETSLAPDGSAITLDTEGGDGGGGETPARPMRIGLSLGL